MSKPRPAQVQYFIDAFDALGPIDVGRFFGGWALRNHGVFFAVVLGETFYFRVGDDEKRAALRALGSEPFAYRTKKKTVVVHRFYCAPTAWLDDPEAMCDFARGLVRAQP